MYLMGITRDYTQRAAGVCVLLILLCTVMAETPQFHHCFGCYVGLLKHLGIQMNVLFLSLLFPFTETMQ